MAVASAGTAGAGRSAAVCAALAVAPWALFRLAFGVSLSVFVCGRHILSACGIVHLYHSGLCDVYAIRVPNFSNLCGNCAQTDPQTVHIWYA